MLKKGLRFKHARVVNWDAEKTPATYQVTKIARGQVYYRAVIDEGLSSERLGSPECCLVAQFPSVCLAISTNAETPHLGWTVPNPPPVQKGASIECKPE